MTTTLLVVQHVEHEGPDLLGRLAEQRGLELKVVKPARGDTLPAAHDSPDCIALVLGGPMGVNERHREDLAWLQRELDWLTAWHQAGRPVIGICLGAQLLAVAAGGSVEALQVGEPPQPLKELGLGAIHWRLNPSEEPLLQGQNDCALALHWHGDRIRLPGQATLLGSSLHCPEQVFRIGRHAIGLQCHLELSEPSLERWIAADADYVTQALGAQGAEQLQRDWSLLGQRLQRDGLQFFSTALDQLEAVATEPESRPRASKRN